MTVRHTVTDLVSPTYMGPDVDGLKRFVIDYWGCVQKMNY